MPVSAKQLEARRRAMKSHMEEVKDRWKNQSGSFNNYWKPRELQDDDDKGNLIRMIEPPWMQEMNLPLPLVEFQQYQMRKGATTTFVVAPSFFDLPDPILEECNRYKKMPAADKEWIRALTAQDQFYAYIVDLEEADKGVQIWQFGKMIYEQVFDIFQNEDYNLITDPEEGHELRVKRWKDKTGFTKYQVTARPKASPLQDAEKFIAEANAINLYDKIKIDTVESMEEILAGKPYDGDEFGTRRQKRDQKKGNPIQNLIDQWTKAGGGSGEEEEEKPKSKKKPVVEDEDEEEEEKAPKPKSKTKPKDEDEEEDEEEAEDDEEEETPKKGAKPSPSKVNTYSVYEGKQVKFDSTGDDDIVWGTVVKVNKDGIDVEVGEDEYSLVEEHILASRDVPTITKKGAKTPPPKPSKSKKDEDDDVDEEVLAELEGLEDDDKPKKKKSKRDDD